MISTVSLLEELFISHLSQLAADSGLTKAETDRILSVFRQAAANPFMSEQHICQHLSDEDGPSCR